MKNFLDRIPTDLFTVFITLLILLIIIAINDQVFKEEIQELREYQQNVCNGVYPDYKKLGVICREK